MMIFPSDRFKKQIDFIIEIDKIKHIFRKTRLFDGSRFENDAEHAWHFALLALVLQEYANDAIDVHKVITMALIHDIVEIDAGDVLAYDTEQRLLAEEKERKAAERIFGILPDEQRDEFKKIWNEFEERKTPEARFAAALDRFEPILQNYMTNFSTWKEHDITHSMLMKTNQHIADGSEILWQTVERMFSEALDSNAITE
ncbi:MAG TPA: HD domain-containing protein [Treponemataceae bacterium]|nr:HD domain-containing protein [Treponemataceae bacterium]